MKKIIFMCTAILIFGLIVSVLLNNKAKMEAKARANNFSTYPVSVINISKQKLTEDLSQVGVIAANNDVAIISETQGKVTAVLVKVGSYVPAGASIVKVDNELQQANYLASETNYEKAQKDWERYQALHKDGLISDSQLESAHWAFKAAEADFITKKRQYNNSTLTTPIAGIVTARPVDVGTMISPGTPVANVVDISKLKVKLSIAEQDAFRLRVSDPVQVETDVYPGVKFPGRIESISVKGDEAHTYPVEIIIPNNPQHPLKAGMFGRVYFNTAAVNNVLAIPREAIIGSVKEPQVFVVENGIAKLRNIVVGSEYGTNLIVLQGLNEGDQVVVNGQVNLKDNVTVTVIK